MATMAPMPTTPDHHHRQNQPPGQTGKKQHVETRRRHQQRRTQIGLLGNQTDRHQQQGNRNQKIAGADQAFTTLKVPGQHQRHGYLHQLRRLDARHTNVQPASRALRHIAEQGHTDQQQHAKHVQRQRDGHHALGWHAGRNPHHRKGHANVERQGVEALGRGTDHHHRREAQDGHHDQGQLPIQRRQDAQQPLAWIKAEITHRRRLPSCLRRPDLRERCRPAACRAGSNRAPPGRSVPPIRHRSRRFRPAPRGRWWACRPAQRQ